MSYLGILRDETEQDKEFNQMLVDMNFQYNHIPVLLFFYQRYQFYPNTIESDADQNTFFSSIHFNKVLTDELKHDSKHDIFHYHFFKKYNYKCVLQRLCDLNNGVMIFFDGGTLMEGVEPTKLTIKYSVGKLYNIFFNYRIFYLPEMETFAANIANTLNSEQFKAITEAKLQMICKDQCGLYLTPIKIKKPIITDFKLNYGEEFEKIHNTISSSLKAEEAHGLILLHGLPGTGKTHYIRYLIQEISEKVMIYVPPDMTSSISSPEFFPFMLEHKNSVLIIEDAENILKSRSSDENTTQSVANLLNLSDGLLGDSLSQLIIATFNCELNSIDPALLRKERLIADYEFGKLSVENAQKLSDKLGFTTVITEPMVLADIYALSLLNAQADST